MKITFFTMWNCIWKNSTSFFGQCDFFSILQDLKFLIDAQDRRQYPIELKFGGIITFGQIQVLTTTINYSLLPEKIVFPANYSARPGQDQMPGKKRLCKYDFYSISILNRVCTYKLFCKRNLTSHTNIFKFDE